MRIKRRMRTTSHEKTGREDERQTRCRGPRIGASVRRAAARERSERDSNEALYPLLLDLFESFLRRRSRITRPIAGDLATGAVLG